MALTCPALSHPDLSYHSKALIAAKQQSSQRNGSVHMTYKSLKRRRSVSPGPEISIVGEPSNSSTAGHCFDPNSGPAAKRARLSSSASALSLVYDQEPSIWRDRLQYSNFAPTSNPNLLPLPLTSANLQRFQEIEYTGAQGMKNSTADSQTSGTTTTEKVWDNLRLNNILYNDRHGEELGASIIMEARTIIEGFRRSAMAEEEQQEIKRTIDYSRSSNELTFIIELWEVLLNRTRERGVRPRDPEVDPDVQWVTEAWKKDGLRTLWQVQFNPDCVPQLDREDALVNWVMPPKVKTPYPDITYGYDIGSCERVIQLLARRFGPSVCKQALFPWFIMEAKSCERPIEAADVQCARGGATIVMQEANFHSCIAAELAKLASSAGGPSSIDASSVTAEEAATADTSSSSPGEHPQSASDPPSPLYPRVDPTNFAFSLSVAPSKAHLHVHFAVDHAATETHYHMLDLDSYDMKKLKDYPELRKHINNILDWGLGPRKQRLDTLCVDAEQSARVAGKRKFGDTTR